MRILVAGATGAIGLELVPQLIAAGHSVVGTTRTAAKAEIIRRMGAKPAIADGLDAPAVRAAAARPGDRALGPGITNYVSKARPTARLFTFGGTPLTFGDTPRGYAAELSWNKPNRRPRAFSGPPHSPA